MKSATTAGQCPHRGVSLRQVASTLADESSALDALALRTGANTCGRKQIAAWWESGYGRLWKEFLIRSRTIALSIVSIIVVAAGAVLWAFPRFSGAESALFGGQASDAEGPVDTSPEVDNSAQPAFALQFPADPNRLTVANASYYGWSLLDRRSGQTTGSANAATAGNTTESMIKPWLVADFLRRESEAGRQPSAQDLNEMTLVIVDSNDPLAESYYQRDGADAAVARLARICGLTNLVIKSTLWGMTTMTPLDAVRYGACLADGRAAGPQWTGWLLDTMKNVRGTVADQRSGAVQGGRWGIIDGLPAELAKDVSFKNGWTTYVDGWHVNCLAIHPNWVLSVMIRTWGNLDKAAAGCAGIAAGLVVAANP